MIRPLALTFVFLGLVLSGRPTPAQQYGVPDRGQPGDAGVQAFLGTLAKQLDARFSEDAQLDPKAWEPRRAEYRAQYLEMLGLSPLPEKTDLRATITGKVEQPDYIVENLHYQSRPGLYVTANLYRPKSVPGGEKLPAILYVCGHSGMGRDGNKTAFQSHGIWFARHGYVCLVVDTLQLGEIPGIHHGTYREGRFWWQSRGYTPAGVEAWNGIRGIDYLISRPDVDASRIGVTGISGGGAVTFWVAAADDRVKVAVPVSGMADLESYVGNRVINGHCDCMFMINTYQWPWTRIASLVAPRPLLFANSDQDAIYPMDSNERISNRLERLYSRFGAGERVDSLVSVGGHAYRGDLRSGIYRFLNVHLKGDGRPVTDGEVDAVAESRPDRPYPIPPARLRAFPTDADLPRDAINGTIDQTFVPMAKVELPEPGKFKSWKNERLRSLQERTFRGIASLGEPVKIPEWDGNGPLTIEWQPGQTSTIERIKKGDRSILLLVGDGMKVEAAAGESVYRIQPRGVGRSGWTTKNPPNYVERAHALVGLTPDTGRILDIARTAAWLKKTTGIETLTVAGAGREGILAAYAGIREPAIDRVMVASPPSSHMESGAPVLLNVLRILDIPEALGMLAPRELILQGGSDALRGRVRAIYESAGAIDRLK